MAYPLGAYEHLLHGLIEKGYALGPVRAYFQRDYKDPFVFIRHDVDRMAARAVRMAAVEARLGAISTYYFRCTRDGRFPLRSITRVKTFGHEVGYHYESVARAGGDIRRALEIFRKELAILRDFTSVETVAAHGSPLERASNMRLPEQVDFAKLGLLGDSSIDIDFTSVLYITDTGGTFGSAYNLRDRVLGRQLSTPTEPAALGRRLHPDSDPFVLLNCHPERWPASRLGLLQAKFSDRLGNLLKQVFAAIRGETLRRRSGNA